MVQTALVQGLISRREAPNAKEEEPGFIDSVVDGFKSFIDGASDCTNGIASGLSPVEVPPKFGNDDVHALCKAAGAAAGLAVDGVVFSTGAAETLGGTAACATGVGCLAGAPAIGLGVTQMAVASGAATMHAEKFGEAWEDFGSAKPNRKRKSGKNDNMKSADALRRENKMVEDISNELGLTRKQRRTLHDQITRQGYDRAEILKIAEEVKAGVW